MRISSETTVPVPRRESKARIAVELLVVYVLLPGAFACLPHRLPAIPVLWLVALYCGAKLMKDSCFDRRKLWNIAALRPLVAQVAVLFIVSAIVVAALVRSVSPTLFLSLPRTRPEVWLTILALYPIVSVYPQELIYRAFFLHRYKTLFRTEAGLLAASSLAFAWMHIVFKNPIAVALTFPAGVLFTYRYLASDSLAVSSFEHALYGCLMFTVGLGAFFLYGSTL